MLTQAGQEYVSSIDIFSRAPRIGAGRQDAVATLDRARASPTSAQNQAELAERRLNELRRGGKATALQLASAEESLRTAKERSAAASKSVADAEKAVDDTRLPTAKGLLETITSQEHRSGRDAKAIAKLSAAGLSERTLAQVAQENADHPGTLERVADTITPKLADAIQRKARQLARDGQIIKTLTGEVDDYRKAGSAAA